MGRGPDTRSLSLAFRASKMAEFPSDQTDTTAGSRAEFWSERHRNRR